MKPVLTLTAASEASSRLGMRGLAKCLEVETFNYSF